MRARSRAIGARPEDGHGTVPVSRRPCRRDPGRAGRAHPDDGRVRIGPDGGEPGVRREAERQRSPVRARARAAASRAAHPRSRARQRPAAVQLRARLHHQRYPARRARPRSIPAGGLDMPGARERSAEEILLEIAPPRAQAGDRAPERSTRTCSMRVSSASGSRPTPRRRRAADQKIRELAARGLGLARAMGALRGVRGIDPGAEEQMVDALRGLYRTALGARAAALARIGGARRAHLPARRRGAARSATTWCCAGRRRAGWMLNIVLDTSGSMTEAIPLALGAVADFCDAVGGRPGAARAVRCDGHRRRDRGARRARELPGRRLRRQRHEPGDAPSRGRSAGARGRSSSPTAISRTRPSRCPTRCCGCCLRRTRAFGRRYGRVLPM